MKAPTECGLIAVKLSLHLCHRSPRLSDPSEQRHGRGSSTALPGSPSTLPPALQITLREFLDSHEMVIPTDGFALA